jgi:hypothetical protein
VLRQPNKLEIKSNNKKELLIPLSKNSTLTNLPQKKWQSLDNHADKAKKTPALKTQTQKIFHKKIKKPPKTIQIC